MTFMDHAFARPLKPDAKRHIVSIQVCRGIAALLVVLSHLHEIELKYLPTNHMGVFLFGIMGVDLFFVISGLVISIVAAGKFNDGRNALAFIYHRFARIYPIYWFYFAMLLPVYLYKPVLLNAKAGHQVDIWNSFFLLPCPHSNIVMQAWTLSYEIYFYLIFFVLVLAVPERLAPRFLLLWGGAMVTWKLLIPEHAMPILTMMSSPLILEFLGGCLLFQIYCRFTFHPNIGKILLVLSLCWMGCFMYWPVFRGNPSGDALVSSQWTQVGCGGLFAFFFLWGVLEMERCNVVRFPAALKSIGDWSYSIYLSHIIVLNIVCRPLVPFVRHYPWVIVLLTALTLPLVLLVGYLSYTWIEVPAMTLLYKRVAKVDARTPQPALP
jgi:peptidoglycan/LPS O-acetylase OafA/YrhL